MLPPLEPPEAAPGSVVSRAAAEALRPRALAPAARTTSASSARWARAAALAPSAGVLIRASCLAI